MEDRLQIGPRTIDLTGQTFGRLVVKEDAGKDKHGSALWRCECECGNVVNVVGGKMTSGDTQSCGCLHRDMMSRIKTTHGNTRGYQRSPTWICWMNMKQRCGNPNRQDYYLYGGRGILVAKPWQVSFEAFLADVGERPEGKTLGRIDNDGWYIPGNVRWETPKQQANNRRRPNIESGILTRKS